MTNFIEIKHATKVFQTGTTTVLANDDINFTVNEGELVVILGPSGAGKTTLLNILGGMDSPTSGQIIINQQDIAQYDQHSLTAYRRTDVGFIFQFYNLVPNLTAKENVELATAVATDALPAEDVLKQVGLERQQVNFPAQLSGGEQQRVAIARALAKNPKLLLCDEPTGALDFETGKQVLQLLENASKQLNKTTIIITHNSAIAQIADRVIQINDAKVKSIRINEKPLPVSQLEW
ncbi:ABC transporter ATP-binding protein [Loigolactobacillus backii]|uniref:ABC transporter ATP-binding protein n=1 Tax=Loigolactobacillus backii TaxID=375175 RepID=UPI0007F0B3B6|nr:ABC transporter ATP-binding protein [Loigolactobacillus backii]ANK58908.1 macrolide ABC transporter ATP-binding protein [Loigolactobacillus backii]ANK63897.1 macrolide ABC transporter ATP-binding protein [Loigolactobacillus backii]ANK66345.1 macrolide ABC transporter ATP-binding protein [Loigolactobacillus backii]MDA5388220.1 ABC transporter ATP-binding protein [Loigolactobacillus backii]MDA5391428.1 ABC transporter ATP-binding protein [Loigolactobacillus backii]